MSDAPPPRVATERLVLRCWEAADAPLVRAAIDESLEHLLPWIPWAHTEPSTLEETAARLTRFREQFERGEDFSYGIFDAEERELLGGMGLHPRIGPGGLEIGYWVHVRHAGRGYATEAARALTDVAFALPTTERVQIRCDPENAASRRVPEKLGYRLVEIRSADKTMPDGRVRDTAVYEVARGEWGAGR